MAGIYSDCSTRKINKPCLESGRPIYKAKTAVSDPYSVSEMSACLCTGDAVFPGERGVHLCQRCAGGRSCAWGSASSQERGLRGAAVFSLLLQSILFLVCFCGQWLSSRSWCAGIGNVTTSSLFPLCGTSCLQCFDAVGWSAGRASGP